MSKVNIMGVMVDKVTMEEAVNRVMGFLESDKLNTIYTPGTEFVINAREDEEFRSILNEGALVIPDGIGVVYASRVFGDPLPERVAGYDLTENVLARMSKSGHKAYFLGGKGDVPKIAAERMIQKYPGLNVGYRDGYFKVEDEDKIIEEINQFGTDYLVVGTGSPRQEKFIHRNKEKLKVKAVIGNGGTLDGYAGVVPRAPEIYQKLGLEWFHRLLKEPTRIGRMMKIPEFMYLAIKERKKWTKNI